MDILTSFQKDFLTHFSKSSLNETFFLTGGTTLSAFFLQHRLSEDLDFFTEVPEQIPQVLPALEEITARLGARIEVRRQFRTFLEVFVHGQDKEVIKCDFAQDSPCRLQPKIHQREYDIYTDNSLDISCNKLSALFDRSEAKDFVDIFFIVKELFPFAELLEHAKQKYVGLDEYLLAVAMNKVEELGLLPRMVKPITKEELKKFFHSSATKLMKP